VKGRKGGGIPGVGVWELQYGHAVAFGLEDRIMDSGECYMERHYLYVDDIYREKLSLSIDGEVLSICIWEYLLIVSLIY
jgi:hypothetical protein